MKIAIIGTRGIPNQYGGFEQFTDFFSTYAAELKHEVTVYCSSLHSYQEPGYKGVRLVHCYDPENYMGTAGQFIYDLNCILHARRQQYDVILQLGYTSSSIWNFLFKKGTKVATNMDGLEWMRTKYKKPVQLFLKHAERWAVQKSDLLIADSIAIQEYLLKKYKVPSFYAAYGATVLEKADEHALNMFQVKPYAYNLLIARMEPENNVETIIKGQVASGSQLPLLVVGNTTNKFGQYLLNRYQSAKVIFTQGIYNQETLKSLRHFANIYFHGHSVGGTNPSLLEAMADGAFISAHDNVFNRAVLLENAWYFKDENELKNLILKEQKERVSFIKNNQDRIRNEYSWKKINDSILGELQKLIGEK